MRMKGFLNRIRDVASKLVEPESGCTSNCANCDACTVSYTWPSQESQAGEGSSSDRPGICTKEAAHDPDG